MSQWRLRASCTLEEPKVLEVLHAHLTIGSEIVQVGSFDLRCYLTASCKNLNVKDEPSACGVRTHDRAGECGKSYPLDQEGNLTLYHIYPEQRVPSYNHILFQKNTLFLYTQTFLKH